MNGKRIPPAKPVDREAGKQYSVPGPKSKAIFAQGAEVMAPSLQSIALYSQIAVDLTQHPSMAAGAPFPL